MIALDKELTLSRCQRRQTTCKSRGRRARFGRRNYGRRPGFASEGTAEERLFLDSRTAAAPRFTATPVRLPASRRPVAHLGALELYLYEVGKVRPLSARAERRLAAKAQSGDSEAREHLLKSNLRRVVGIAQEYEVSGLCLFDLIAEGNLGLLKALGRFNPAKADKFSTLASWWIRQAIKRALANYAKSRGDA